jgi:hypothetical protein
VTISGVTKQAWRLTSLVKVAEVGIVDPNNPQAYFRDAFGNYYGGEYGRWFNHTQDMGTILATPSLGVIYFWCCGTASEIQVGLQVTAAGAAPNLTRNVDQGPTVGLAGYCVTPNTANLPTCDLYSVTVTGDDKSGTISGMWLTESKISATKGADGITLTGTLRVAEAGWATGNSIPVHYIDYQFTAQRVP